MSPQLLEQCLAHNECLKLPAEWIQLLAHAAGEVGMCAFIWTRYCWLAHSSHFPFSISPRNGHEWCQRVILFDIRIQRNVGHHLDSRLQKTHSTQREAETAQGYIILSGWVIFQISTPEPRPHAAHLFHFPETQNLSPGTYFLWGPTEASARLFLTTPLGAC